MHLFTFCYWIKTKKDWHVLRIVTGNMTHNIGNNWNNFFCHYRILGTGIGSNVNSSQPYSVHSTYNVFRINAFVMRPIHTSTTRKCKGRSGSYRYWFVLLQYFRLVHNLNWWRFLCKHRRRDQVFEFGSLYCDIIFKTYQQNCGVQWKHYEN